jgi:hypothetical protein
LTSLQALSSSAAAGSRVEGAVEAVAHEVEADEGEREDEAWTPRPPEFVTSASRFPRDGLTAAGIP